MVRRLLGNVDKNTICSITMQPIGPNVCVWRSIGLIAPTACAMVRCRTHEICSIVDVLAVDRRDRSALRI